MVVSRARKILGSRNVTKRELAEVITLVQTGRVRPIVTGLHPLEDAEIIHTRLSLTNFLTFPDPIF